MSEVGRRREQLVVGALIDKDAAAMRDREKRHWSEATMLASTENATTLHHKKLHATHHRGR